MGSMIVQLLPPYSNHHCNFTCFQQDSEKTQKRNLHFLNRVFETLRSSGLSLEVEKIAAGKQLTHFQVIVPTPTN